MTFGLREVLAVAAVAFLAFLVVKLRPGGAGRAALRAEVKAARARATDAKTAAERAVAFADAAELAVQSGSRWTVAVGLFLRAAKADPTSAAVVERMIATLLKRRSRALETILWRRLAHLPWDDAHRGAIKASAQGLVQIYAKERRDPARAEVMKRLLSRL